MKTKNIEDNFEDKNWIFISDSQDIEPIYQLLGRKAKEFDSFFVKIENDDYSEIWGIWGIIPYPNKAAYNPL